MPRYLILCNNYMYSTDANGICIRNIVNELKKNAEVFIVSESQKDGLLFETENEKVYGIRKSLFSRCLEKYGDTHPISTLFRYGRAIFSLAFFPNVSPVITAKMYSLASNLIRVHDIDTIVCVYRPFESIYAGLKIKGKNNDVRVFGYHLDLMMSPNNSNPLVVKIKKKRAKIILDRELLVFDRLILPKSSEGEFSGSNVRFAGFPLLTFENSKESSFFQYESDSINMTYIGSIDGINRSTHYLLKLIEGVRNHYHKNLQIHLWGNVSDSERKLIQSYSFAAWHGIVEHKGSNTLLLASDFLINLSNRQTYKMVPSKIFQLFAVGNPIINVVENSNDVSLPYFYKNKLVLNIFVNEDKFSEQVASLNIFIEAMRGMRNPKDELERLYGENSPLTVVDFFR